MRNKIILSIFGILVSAVLFLSTAPAFVPEIYSSARIVVETEQATLWKYAYTDHQGVTWVCHWLQNKKLVSGKLHSGLSCTPWVYQECVCPEPCPDPDAHLPKSPLF